ncbi:hypothetical protein MASR2M48_07420 [Spirochaetota bacterium]
MRHTKTRLITQASGNDEGQVLARGPGVVWGVYVQRRRTAFHTSRQCGLYAPIPRIRSTFVSLPSISIAIDRP